MVTDESEMKNAAMTIFQEGIELDAEGKIEEAVGAYQKAIDIYPAIPQVHYNLGVDFAMLGNYDQAIRAWKRAVWLESDYKRELANAFDIDCDIRETEVRPMPSRQMNENFVRTETERIYRDGICYVFASEAVNPT